jgi:predicted TPR repeat methyltransferase
MTDEAYVEAADSVLKSQAYADAVARAEASNKLFTDAVDVPLKDLLGADYKQHLFGKTRVSRNPPASVETDFTDGTMRAYFHKDASGNWNLHTMYPNPKQ